MFSSTTSQLHSWPVLNVAEPRQGPGAGYVNQIFVVECHTIFFVLSIWLSCPPLNVVTYFNWFLGIDMSKVSLMYGICVIIQ